MKKYSTLEVNLLHKGVTASVKLRFLTEGYVQFFNARHIYLTINPEERCWFEFLCERVGSQCRVYVGQIEQDEFVKETKEITGGKTILKPKSINNYTRKLVEKGLLLKTTESGMYYINPKYAYSGTKKNRVEDLEYLFHQANLGRIEVWPLLDRPLEEIFLEEPLPF